MSRNNRVGFVPSAFDIGMTRTVTKRNVRMSCPRADSVDASMALIYVSDAADASDKESEMDDRKSGSNDSLVAEDLNLDCVIWP